MPVDRAYLIDTLRDLVRTNSINPAFSDGKNDEQEIAAHVAKALGALGLEVQHYDAAPGRRSVVGRLRGGGGGRSLMLYAHMDTVGVDGMPEPFSASVRDGRMYGRGTYDMKGGLAACITAAKAIVDSGTALAGDLLVVAVADEEVASIGMSEVLSHVRADAAIVTEATELGLCLAHKGFAWIEVKTLGIAAHGSRFMEGVDANMRMGRFLSELERLERDLRARPAHPLVGPPSLHAAVLRGGTGTSTYAAECRLEIERRTIPGESEGQVMREIEEIIARLKESDKSFVAESNAVLTRSPFEADQDAGIVRAVREAATDVLGTPPPVIGQSYWMDAALLADAGVSTVVIGPVGHGAHAIEEWVDLDSLVALIDILTRAAIDFCGVA